ncbi:MAG: ABC transporter substrate-binding protein [Rhodospirillaceae bacterium]|nr:ABC transporter substrate-binding protein [Rhodospirillaceae bacterium]
MAAVAVAAALTASPVSAADKTLRIALEALPLSQGNPHRTSLSPTIYSITAIFDALTQLDAQGRLIPALAERWENIDPLTWRFYLRPGVTFSNGTPLTAEAFAVSVNYLASDAGFKEGLKQEIGFLKSARVVNDLTVDIVTTEPVATFPRYASALMAAEPNLWNKLGREAFGKSPVGTGPFKADSIEPTRWRLSAFAGSWRKPKADKLELLMLPDAASRVQALASGRVDVAMIIGPDNIEALESAGMSVKNFISATSYAITLMTTRGGPFADVRVRRAVNMAVDRTRLTAQLLAERTIPTGQPATRLVYGYDPDIAAFPYDPEQAKKLLAEAGYPKGFTFTLEAPTSATANDTLVLQQVQSDLRAVGVTMNITTIPYPLFLTKSIKTDFEGEAFPIMWTSWPTHDVIRAMNSHSCLREVPWFCDPAMTPLYKAALAERDEAKALSLRRQLARMYRDQAAGMLLYELPIFVGLNPRVTGFNMIGYRIFYDQIGLKP